MNNIFSKRTRRSMIFISLFIISTIFSITIQTSNSLADRSSISKNGNSGVIDFNNFIPSAAFDSERYNTILEGGSHLYINVSEHPTDNQYMFHIHTNVSSIKVNIYILTFENYLKFNDSNPDFETEYSYLNIHELTVNFELNQSKQWALVIYNNKTTDLARFSYFLENDRPLLPIYDEGTHTYVRNDIVVEGGDNFTIPLNFRKGQTLRLGFKSFFPAEKIQKVYIFDEANYQKYQKSENPEAYVTIENSAYYKMPLFKVPETGNYYIVFDNSEYDRTVVFSCYYDDGIYYGEDGKLTLQDLSNFASIFTNFNLLSLFLIAGLMVISIIAIIIMSNKETGNEKETRNAEKEIEKNE